MIKKKKTVPLKLFNNYKHNFNWNWQYEQIEKCPWTLKNVFFHSLKSYLYNDSTQRLSARANSSVRQNTQRPCDVRNLSSCVNREPAWSATFVFMYEGDVDVYNNERVYSESHNIIRIILLWFMKNEFHYKTYTEICLRGVKWPKSMNTRLIYLNK